jgi:hypothetical protein
MRLSCFKVAKVVIARNGLNGLNTRRWLYGGIAGLVILAVLITSQLPVLIGFAHSLSGGCVATPSIIWLKPSLSGGSPEQTVQLVFSIGNRDTTSNLQNTVGPITDTSTFEATVNDNRARVAQAEVLPDHKLSVLVAVPETTGWPVHRFIQLSTPYGHCTRLVRVPQMTQWRVYLAHPQPANVQSVNYEQVLQGLLPNARRKPVCAAPGRTDPSQSTPSGNTSEIVNLLAHSGLSGIALVVTNTDTLKTTVGTQGKHLFWRQSADGGRVLMWLQKQEGQIEAHANTYDPFARFIAHTASQFEAARSNGQYAPDAFLLLRPPVACDVAAEQDRAWSDYIAKWNDSVAFPHIVESDEDEKNTEETSTRFSEYVAQNFGQQIPAYSGELDSQSANGLNIPVVNRTEIRHATADWLSAQKLSAIALTQNAQTHEALTRQISTGTAESEEPDPYIWVFNPLSWERSAPVTVTLQGAAPLYVTEMDTGNTIPSQLINTNTLLFVAHKVPALGYKVFKLGKPQVQMPAQITVASHTLTSTRFVVSVDGSTGEVTLADRMLNQKFIGSPKTAGLKEDATLSIATEVNGPVAARLSITRTLFTYTVSVLDGLPYIFAEGAEFDWRRDMQDAAAEAVADALQGIKLDWEQHTPMFVRRLPAAQQGVLPGTSRSFGTLKGDVVISALKPAQDSNGTIVRLWNPTDQRQSVILDMSLPGLMAVQQTNGLERNLGSPVDAGGIISVDMAAHSYSTFRLFRSKSQVTLAPDPTASPSVPSPAPASATVMAQPTSPALAAAATTAPAQIIQSTPTPALTSAPQIVPSATAVRPPSVASGRVFLPVLFNQSAQPAPQPSATANIVAINAAGLTPTPVNASTSTPISAGVPVATATPAPQTPVPTQAAPATPTPIAPTATPRLAPLLDAFEQPNQTLAGNWEGNANRFVIRNNQLVQAQPNRESNIYDIAYWKTPFGPTQFASVKLSDVGPDDAELNLMLKWQGGSTRCHAIAVSYEPQASLVRVYTCSSEATDWLPAHNPIPVDFAPGDVFAASADDKGSVSIYKNSTLVGQASVATWPHYAKDGKVGLWVDHAPGLALDDFRGE